MTHPKISVPSGNKSTMSNAGWVKILVVLIIAVSGLLPPILYWFCIGSAPTINAERAVELLSMEGSSAILVDMRDSSAFESEHLEGAVNWPYRDIMALESKDDVPEQYGNKTLLMICSSGLESAVAARKLRKISNIDAYSIKGGIQEWIGVAKGGCSQRFCSFQTASGETRPLPYREASFFEQLMACVAAFGAKPAYMLLSFMLAVIMRRLKSHDMVALRWAFIFFFIGEGFCAINYIFLSEDSYLVEYLHSFGMVLAFGFTTFAFFEGVDLRLVKYSDANEKCAAIPLCGACIKYTDVPCGFKRAFLWLIPSVAALSFIPLLASLHTDSYNTDIFGTLYNYSHPVIFQIFETRYAPILTIVFSAIAYFTLRLRGNNSILLAKIFFAAAAGFLGFSMFRLILFGVYRDNMLWYVCWEEFTEFLYIGFAAIVLWIFHGRLFAEDGNQ